MIFYPLKQYKHSKSNTNTFFCISKIYTPYSKPSTVIEVTEKKIEIPKPKPSYNQPNKVYKSTTSLPGLFYY